MSDNMKISVLSNKSVKLLTELDEVFKERYDYEQPNSFVQNEENIAFKNQIMWIISKTDLDEKVCGKCIKSPYVEIQPLDIRKLWLEMYPNGVKSGSESTAALYVCFYNLPQNVCVVCDVSVVNNREILLKKTFFGKSCCLKEKKIGFTNFCKGNELQNYLVHEKIIIQCRVKLFSKLQKCVSGQQTYIVNEVPVIKNYMEDILESGKYSDVVLKVQSSEIKSHKCILALASPPMRILFKLNKEDKQDLSDEKYTTIKDVLSFLYTGNIQIFNFHHAWELYIAAHKYELLSLKDICSAYLNVSLTEENISYMFDLSREHEDELLLKACIAFIKDHETEFSMNKFLKRKYVNNKKLLLI